MSRKVLVPLVLPADPTVPMEAATKQYVDNSPASAKTWIGTQAQFDALVTLDPAWAYYVTP